MMACDMSACGMEDNEKQQGVSVGIQALLS